MNGSKLKSAISLFPYCLAELFSCVFWYEVLEIADFIFYRSLCGLSFIFYLLSFFGSSFVISHAIGISPKYSNTVITRR